MPLVRLIPFVLVVLWSSGFIFTKLAVEDAEPLTFLLVRFAAVAAILGVVALITRAPWPDARHGLRAGVVGALTHGLYLGPVYIAIDRGMSAGVSALIVPMPPKGHEN